MIFLDIIGIMLRCLNLFLLVYYVWDKEVCRSRLEFKKDIIIGKYIHMILNPTPGNYAVPFFLADVFFTLSPLFSARCWIR